MDKRYIAAAIVAAVLTGCSSSFSVPGRGNTETSQLVYQCEDGQRLDITYYNNDPNRLAVIKTAGEPAIVMANVISGSGAKYNGNVYQWWSKGRSGSFSDLMKDKTTECQAVN